jgi:hypothetical protein
LNRRQRAFIRMGNARLAVVLTAALMAWAAFAWSWFSGWWLLLPLAVFVALVIVHERVAQGQEFARRAIAYYERGLGRVDGRWMGTGSAGEQFEDASHVYADDLDIFGRGSLFELLSTARTAAGEATLAQWLKAPAAAGEVAARHEAIADLRARIQLREDLALLGEDVRAGVHAESLTAWGEAPPVRLPPGARALALAVSLATIATFVAFMAQELSFRPFAVAVLAGIALRLVLRRPVMQIAAAADTPAHDLQILALLLARLEREPFTAPRLTALKSKLDVAGSPASRRIARLERWMDYLDSSDHFVVRIIGPLVLWREQAAMGVEAWRRAAGPRIGAWISSVAELEALSSLATFAFERPTASFPELVEGGPIFDAAELRHPLMNPKICVPNDVRVGGETTLLVVSGSNMSGKSTLLRSVGLNAVLAWAGAPVTAARLRISPLAVGASIRVVDSLQDGRSRFYAEITRLRQIVDLTTGDRPALFLLDELLSGTNSHDRRVGAEAVVRALLERGAAGLVTTHDLALTEIVSSLNGRAANVHFDDRIEDGRISFDYKLKPGVVEHSNALELMRAVGLDV